MAQERVTKETLDLVRLNFIAKRNEIVAHSKPWTPWALAQFLEIDDKDTVVPAELIVYAALKASAPNRIGIADPIVKVYV